MTNLEFIILHHCEERGVLPAGGVHYATHGRGQPLLNINIYRDIAVKYGSIWSKWNKASTDRICCGRHLASLN